MVRTPTSSGEPAPSASLHESPVGTTCQLADPQRGEHDDAEPEARVQRDELHQSR